MHVRRGQEETTGTRSCVGITETLAINQCGGQEAFVRALNKGELRRVVDNGVEFFVWRQIQVDHKVGSSKSKTAAGSAMALADKEYDKLVKDTDDYDMALESGEFHALAVPQTPRAEPAAPTRPSPMPLSLTDASSSQFVPGLPLPAYLKTKLVSAEEL